MTEHWTLEVADRIAEMTKRMRLAQMPERYIDEAVKVYLATVAAERGATLEVASSP